MFRFPSGLSKLTPAGGRKRLAIFGRGGGGFGGLFADDATNGTGGRVPLMLFSMPSIWESNKSTIFRLSWLGAPCPLGRSPEPVARRKAGSSLRPDMISASFLARDSENSFKNDMACVPAGSFRATEQCVKRILKGAPVGASQGKHKDSPGLYFVAYNLYSSPH